MKRFISVLNQTPLASTGTHALAVSSGLVSYKKTAGDSTPVYYWSFGDKENHDKAEKYKSFEVYFAVSGAVLDAAATATVSKVVYSNASTPLVRTELTNTTAFYMNSSTTADATPVEVGSWKAVITLSEAYTIPDLTKLQVELTLNGGGSTVTDIYGILVSDQ